MSGEQVCVNGIRVYGFVIRNPAHAGIMNVYCPLREKTSSQKMLLMIFLKREMVARQSLGTYEISPKECLGLIDDE